MPTQTKENYLKAIYHLYQKDNSVSITELGKKMEVSKPTVNDMVKKLQEKGWLNYERYKPLTLTEKGEKQAGKIIRKHRLAEMFLVKIMGFGWEEVHEMAEEIEHLQKDVFFDRMDELLGHPTVDPHGSPIPDKEGNFNNPDYLSLSDIEKGETVELKALRDSSVDFLLFLNKKEIRLGLKFTIVQKEDFDDSVTVYYQNGRHKEVFSQAVSRRLLVEVV